MPKLVGATLALIALAASILAQVGPIDCLLRGMVAYIVGRFATQLWYVFFTIRVERGKPESSEPKLEVVEAPVEAVAEPEPEPEAAVA